MSLRSFVWLATRKRKNSLLYENLQNKHRENDGLTDDGLTESSRWPLVPKSETLNFYLNLQEEQEAQAIFKHSSGDVFVKLKKNLKFDEMTQ